MSKTIALKYFFIKSHRRDSGYQTPCGVRKEQDCFPTHELSDEC